MNSLMEKSHKIYPHSESMRVQWIVQTIYLGLKKSNDMEPINQHAIGRYFYGHTTRK
jgi:hypothetical protein